MSDQAGKAGKAGNPGKTGKDGKAQRPTAASEETKAKFRAALDRKKAHGGKESAGEGDGKVHESHGPAAGQRMFRRKAGG
jgi:hypothetical protein